MRQQRLWRRGPEGEILRVHPEESRPRAARSASETIERVAEEQGARRARLGLGLRLGFRDAYDYLGAVLLMSVLWTALAGLALIGGHAAGTSLVLLLPVRSGSVAAELIVLGCSLAGGVLAGGPLTAGLFRFARNAAARQEPELFDLAWGFRTAPGPSIALAGLQAAGSFVLIADCYFFFAQKGPYWMALGVVFVYALLFWSLTSLYAWPLLAEQPAAPLQVLKKSALLVLDNLGFSAGLGLVTAVLGLVLWGTVVAGLLLWPGGLALLLTQATRELLRKYRLLPPDSTLDPVAGETHELGGYGWHE